MSTFLCDALLYVVIHCWFLVHPLEAATFLCHAIVESLDLSRAIAATLPFCHVALLDKSTVVDLTAQVSAHHHRQVIYGDLGARRVVMPELGVLEALGIESLGVFVRCESLHIILGGLPDEVSVERVALLLLFLLLPEVFCHLLL